MAHGTFCEKPCNRMSSYWEPFSLFQKNIIAESFAKLWKEHVKQLNHLTEKLHN